MKIGVSTSIYVGNDPKWEHLKELPRLGFKEVEFQSKVTRITWEKAKLLPDFFKGHKVTVSIHSVAKNFFCSDKIVSQAEYWILKEDIRILSLLKGSTVIFHIEKDQALTPQEKKKLQELVNFANKNKIKLCLENDSDAYAGKYFAKLLSEIKGLNFCLDIGHLNIALRKGYISDLENFLRSVKDRVTRMHIHYNNGDGDQHKDLNKKGQKFLLEILKVLKKKDITLIIETRNIKQALKVKKFLSKII